MKLSFAHKHELRDKGNICMYHGRIKYESHLFLQYIDLSQSPELTPYSIKFLMMFGLTHRSIILIQN